MAAGTASASESVCASTGASPAAAPVGTGESAPNPRPPATRSEKETTTIAGGGGAANVIIIEALVCSKDWGLASKKDRNYKIGSILEDFCDTVSSTLADQAETENQATDEGYSDAEDHEDSDVDDMDGWIWTTED